VSFCLLLSRNRDLPAPLLLDPRHAGNVAILRDTGKNPRSPAAVQKPAADAGRRIRASRGRFSRNQGNRFLSDALRGAGRAVATARAKRILTMGAFLTATGLALGLVSHLGGVSHVGGMTMNMHPIGKFSDQLITTLRRITVVQLRQLVAAPVDSLIRK
jgi:hypothetical protein